MENEVPGQLIRTSTGLMDDEDDALLNDDEPFLPADYGSPGPDGDPVQEQFEHDVRDAEAFSQRNFGSDMEKRKRMPAFVNERLSNWNRTTQEGRSFLHHLAYYECSCRPPVSLRWLMARAISKLPHQMGAMDMSKRTPLTVALAKGNEMFIHAACKNQTPKTQLQFQSALVSECEHHDNDREITCLHTALTCSLKREEYRGEYIEAMCKFVPESMFTVRDIDGRTPLHLAVEYERCCKTQVAIVNNLLFCGPKALLISIPSRYSKRNLSVYQYHKSSYKQPDRRRLMSGFSDGKLNQGLSRDGRLGADRVKADLKKAGSKMEKSSTDLQRLPKDKYERADLTGPGLKQKDSALAPSTPRASDDARPYRSMLDTRSVGTSVAGVLATDPAQILQREEEKAQASETIAEQLKLFYLRSGGPHDALSSLHVHGERDKELWFDFGQPKKLSQKEFRKTFGHLRFDSALQYVALSQVELLEEDDSDDEDGDGAARTQPRGRKDMVSVFRWLQGKGVKHIVKVIVDDLRSIPHSDEAIEDALKPFDIEILDWRRLDLDPDLLAGVGKHLREVHLQWSGRNATLRAWSEREGLAMIPTLEDIYITQVEGLESDERTRKNLEAFESRLVESWPQGKTKPQVHPPKPLGALTRGSAIQPIQQRERSVDPHRWMQCMEEFASYFRQIRALRDKISDPALGPVKVALIDDGTDITHPDLRGTVIPGKSFHHYQENSTWRVSPYWDSASGHGTLMARLIHRICPSAIIHAIKLQTFAAEGSKKRQIDPESAVRAIEYAAELGAHIISMSWTIKPPAEPIKTAFDDAIHMALNQKGILMFCAASDQGQSADRTYPHKSNPNSFRIGAARSTGAILDTVGDQHDLGFIFPGHEVVVDHAYDGADDREFGGYEAHSGSSVAAALAAGLAALVTECVRLGVIYTDKTKPHDRSVGIGRDDLASIRGLEKMKYALQWIGRSGTTGSKYIEVWNTFNDVAVKLKNSEGSPEDQLEHISALARQFLRKV